MFISALTTSEHAECMRSRTTNGYFLHVMLPPGVTVYYFTSIKGDGDIGPPILAADQAQISRLTMDEVHMYDDGRSAPPTGVPERLNVTCVQRRGNSWPHIPAYCTPRSGSSSEVPLVRDDWSIDISSFSGRRDAAHLYGIYDSSIALHHAVESDVSRSKFLIFFRKKMTLMDS